jgi:sporulation protein YlmC with PRC-barrel domain
MSAKDRAGESLGAIKDVVIDPTSGRVHYLVLSSGGALGMAGKLYAVPIAKAHAGDARAMTLDVRKQDLASMADTDAAPRADAGGARLRRASDVLKAGVRDSHGGRIGKVEDMLVDIAGGRVRQVVVKFDRAWNPNDTLIALPMASFADGSTRSFKAPVAAAAAPPRNTAPPLALMNPSGEPTKGTASADTPPGGVETKPPAIAAGRDAAIQPIERPPLQTTTSYADDEDLVFKGTREQLRSAPAYQAKAG